jgi:capsular exopolysaccharide synthesis family protein
LTTLLRLKHKFDDAVQPTSIMNLDLLPAGPVPSSSSEWLASAQMESVLAEAKERYDVVIVDTPSVLEATDASIVAALCDGVLLVINQGRTRKETVLQAKADLSKVKARFLGVVMNDARTRA